MKIVAVRDSAMAQFMNPFAVQHIGMAIRGFGDEVAKKDGPIGQHPEDYELFEIGDYNIDTGKITPREAPLSISRAKDFVKGD